MVTNNQNITRFLVRADRKITGIGDTTSDGIHVDYTDGMTIREYEELHGCRFDILTLTEFLPLYEAYLNSLITPPKEISEEECLDMMEILPPCRYHMWDGVTLFHMREKITGSIAVWCARYKSRYYTFRDHDYADAQYLVLKVKQAAEHG